MFDDDGGKMFRPARDRKESKNRAKFEEEEDDMNIDYLPAFEKIRKSPRKVRFVPKSE